MLFKILVYKLSSNFESFREMQLYLVPGDNCHWELGTNNKTNPGCHFLSQGAQLGVFGCVHPQHVGLLRQLLLYCWGNRVWIQPSVSPVKHWGCASVTASGLGAASPRQCWQLMHAPGRSHCSHIYTQCVPTLLESPNSCIICRDSRSLTWVCCTAQTIMMVKRTYRNPWCQTQNCITNQYPKTHFQEKFAF